MHGASAPGAIERPSTLKSAGLRLARGRRAESRPTASGRVSMNAQLSFVVAAAIACGPLVACGSSGSGASPTNPVPDAGAAQDAAPEAAAAEDSGPPRDPGAPSTTYPAFKPDFGQIVDNGGLVLTSPTVVAITWDSDPSQASFDQFADTVGETAYWHAACGEYGVGQAACGAVNHVHIKTAAPAMMMDQ